MTFSHKYGDTAEARVRLAIHVFALLQAFGRRVASRVQGLHMQGKDAQYPSEVSFFSSVEGLYRVSER